MKNDEILIELQRIFCEVLENGVFQLEIESNMETIEGWDSLNHILLVVTIEKYFRIKFDSKEILTWKNVGEIIDSIALKLEK